MNRSSPRFAYTCFRLYFLNKRKVWTHFLNLVTMQAISFCLYNTSPTNFNLYVGRFLFSGVLQFYLSMGIMLDLKESLPAPTIINKNGKLVEFKFTLIFNFVSETLTKITSRNQFWPLLGREIDFVLFYGTNTIQFIRST